MARSSLVVSLTAALLLLPAGAAAAQAGEGTTSLELDRSAGAVLRVTGSRGAQAFGRRAALPVVAGRVARDEWRIYHGGVLTLRARGRAVRLADVEVRLGRRAVVVARLLGRRRAVLTSDARPRLDRRTRTAVLRGARLRVTPAFAAVLRRALGLRPSGGRFGQLDVAARVNAIGVSGAVRLPARPPNAVDVVAGSVTWHLRDSFVQYLNGGEGVRAAGGAREGAPTRQPGSDQPLVYDLELPLRRGWHDPASGLTVLELGGVVGFRYRAHGIDFAVRDAVVELGGPRQSRATFRFTGRAGEDFDGGRAPLVDLRPRDARENRMSPDGRTRTLVEIPGAVPAQRTVFSGFYQPGDPFGWMTVNFTVAGGAR